MMSEVDHEVVVIGAGFGGMGATIALKRIGVDDVLIIDRATDVGGTWHANTYPGVAVDIASVAYSFSFQPNPDWSRLHAPGAELKGYAARIADEYDLRRHLRLETSVDAVAWDDATATWTVHVADDDPVTCRVLILATGFLSQPKRPDIDGLDTFAGNVVHTSAWDHDLDLTGQRVAVIGTGATAVQLLPELAPIVERLDVHQRTPIWVTAKPDPSIPAPVRAIFRRVPMLQRAARLAGQGIYETLAAAMLFHRQVPWGTAFARRVALLQLRRQVPDVALRERLTPQYGFGCKRPTFSNTYYPTFMRDNVDLVTDRIERVEPEGIVAGGVKREVDTIVLATGFHLMDDGNYPPFPVTGREGRDLGSRWRQERFDSYQGITSHGYPNLCNLSSPYAYSGLSFFTTIESQMIHLTRLVGEMRERGAATFEPRAEAQQRFVRTMRDKMQDTVFASPSCTGANSYYLNEHGEAALARLAPTPAAFIAARTFPLDDYAFQIPSVEAVVVETVDAVSA